jgi:pimeloyl-ACP methyl ester carboxylesterase
MVTKHLTNSDVPVTVIYGDQDSVVPTELSARVADQAPILAERVVIRGANHNDEVMFGPPVGDAVARLAKAVA